MATMKAKKGNPFEYNVMYSLMQIRDDWEVIRPDSNYEGVDLIVKTGEDDYFFVECKNRNLSWTQLVKLYKKNENKVYKLLREITKNVYGDFPEYYIVFKPKRCEPLVFYCNHTHDGDHYYMTSFETLFDGEYKTRPKGFTLEKLMTKKQVNSSP
ncbi:MAG: hypothetical protein HPY57_13005 [Ignavibacteria bacterium]|nr:hypothetical protein [Ignavibacteria bacterium]